MRKPWFQLTASLIAMVMIANLQYAWSLFVEPIRAAHLGPDGMPLWQRSEVQVAFALFFIPLQTFVQPLDGWLMDRIGPRFLITIAGVLCGVGWSLMGQADTLTQLNLYYAFAGVGAAFVYSGCVGSALKWYPARRGFAAGLIAAGFGGGSGLFNLIIQKYLIPEYGYRDHLSHRRASCRARHYACRPVSPHPDASFIAPKPAAGAAVTKSRRNTRKLQYGADAVRGPHFYILYVMFVTVATGGLYLTANQVSIATDWGMMGVVATIATLGPLANGRAGSSGVGFRTVWDVKTRWSSRFSCRPSASGRRRHRSAEVGDTVRGRAGLTVLHLGRDLFALPLDSRRLLRQQARDIELQPSSIRPKAWPRSRRLSRNKACGPSGVELGSPCSMDGRACTCVRNDRAHLAHSPIAAQSNPGCVIHGVQVMSGILLKLQMILPRLRGQRG